MRKTIKIRFTNSRRPAPENLGVISSDLQVLSITDGLFSMTREFSSSEELSDYLRSVNLHPCVQLAWLQ